MEIVRSILEYSNEYLIRGIFVSVALIILARLSLKNKLDTDYSRDLVKWILVLNSILSLFGYIIVASNPNEHLLLLNRAFGPYWWAFWIIVLFNTILPILLLIKKIGSSLFIIFTITFFMNLPWLYESFVIHITSLNVVHFYNPPSDYNPYALSYYERSALVNGFSLGIVVLVIGNGIHFIKNRYINEG